MVRTLVLASILLLGTFVSQAGSVPAARGTLSTELADSRVSLGDSTRPMLDDTKQDKKESDKERKARKLGELIEASNQKEVAKVGIELARTTFTKMGLPDSFITQFQERMGVDEILAITLEVYDKNFEEEQIDALTAFYRTEQGKKIAEALPEITKESTEKGSELGERIAKEIVGQGK